MKKYLVALLVAIMTAFTTHAQTVRICSYNLLNFPGSTGEARLPCFKLVIDAIAPNILFTQEMVSDDGAAMFLSGAFDSTWSRSTFQGGDAEYTLFYRHDLFQLMGIASVPTDLRMIEIYELEFVPQPNRPHLFIATSHLKASTGSDNEERRLYEVNAFLNYFTTNLSDENVFFGGDFNFYSSSEPAYQALLADNNFKDPLDASGNWHDNASFASIHTQSPRTLQFGGGANGGLDDRFDFVLATSKLFDETAWEYSESSYTAFGNDGRHLNLALIDTVDGIVNSVVATEIASAIHAAADHLPVYLDLVYMPEDGLDERHSSIAKDYEILSAYPNPFNPTLSVVVGLSQRENLYVTIYNSIGQKVGDLSDGTATKGYHTFSFDGRNVTNGVYFVHVSVPNKMNLVRKVVLVK